MIRVDVVELPQRLAGRSLDRCAVGVFDVLRATTSMATAVAAGATEIRIFDSLDAANAAANPCAGDRLLCGEQRCVRPEGFDLGNSPVEFAAADLRGKTLYMSTTNGTRAIVAARGAAARFAAALVNANATARYIAGLRMDIVLLCAGTNGEPAPEDMLGAGAILHELPPIATTLSDSATAALDMYRQTRGDIVTFFRETAGGRNIIAAGLEPDLEFAAAVNRFDCVVEVCGDPPVARRRL